VAGVEAAEEIPKTSELQELDGSRAKVVSNSIFVDAVATAGF
jgi:hypothetical protein